MKQKVIAFFPEAAYGPALNSVGIAQACEALGHKAVFLTDPGMSGVYAGYGFEEHMVNMSAPMPADRRLSACKALITHILPPRNGGGVRAWRGMRGMPRFGAAYVL